MTRLGAILAGGQATRFGSDKAAAIFEGRALIDHVADALRPHVDALIVVGRDWPGLVRIDDLPGPGLGPLGGLLGALEHAAAQGHDEVLTCGCDVLGLDGELIAALSPAPAFVENLPIIGQWPVSAVTTLRDRMTHGGNRSVYGFAEAINARAVPGPNLRNINAPADLI